MSDNAIKTINLNSPFKKAHNFDDKTGKKFHQLKVLGFHGFQILYNGKKKSLWKCICDCGKEIVVRGGALSSGTTKSCGCRKHEATVNFNIRTKTKKIYDGFSYIWQSYKKGAKDRGLSFNLSKDQFRTLTQGKCYYCGRMPSQKRVARKDRIQGFIYNGIDRMDSTIGYKLSNCVSCCRFCNIAKGKRSSEEFLSLIKKIYEHLFFKLIKNQGNKNNDNQKYFS